MSTINCAPTSPASGRWAIVTARAASPNTSYNDFEIVAANLLDSDPRRVSDRIFAYALYTDPPLGRAGMTEAEVRKSGRPALIGKRPMTRVARALEKGEPQGFMKVLIDAQSKQILGVAILGTGGDEVVHSVLDIMYAKAPYTVIQRAVHIHPTVSELIPTMLGELLPLRTASSIGDSFAQLRALLISHRCSRRLARSHRSGGGQLGCPLGMAPATRLRAGLPGVCGDPLYLERAGHRRADHRPVADHTQPQSASGFGARIVTGGLCGGAFGAAADGLAIGAVAGVVGAIVGTLGGYEARVRLARAVGKDLPIALLEDAIAIGGAFLLVSRH